MSMLRQSTFLVLVGFALAATVTTRAADNFTMDAEVGHLDRQWAHIKYEVKSKEEQLKEIDALSKEAATVVARYPAQVKPLLWDGIITSEEAAMTSIFHKLALATAARKLFEQAEAIDQAGPDGAVAMSLGVIYYRVPGFPMGFGDTDKARRYLETALAIDPNGLDSNYFYGDFLFKRGKIDQARSVLTHALDAPANPTRPVWDAGRRAEVRALISKMDHRTSA